MLRRARGGPVLPTGTYTDWHWPASPGGYTSFEWGLEPRTDPSPDGYFWSHQFWLVGGEAGYLGLQTRGSDPPGKIAIFSVWKAVAAEGPAVAAPFSGEGEGQTVRIPFAWVVGSAYRLRVTSAGGGTWEAWVGPAAAADGGRPTPVDPAPAGGDTLVGRIRVPASWGGLQASSVMWTERYSGPLSSCADLRRAEALFSAPTADRGRVRPTGHHNHLAQKVHCPGSSVVDAPGGVVQVMGGQDSLHPPAR